MTRNTKAKNSQERNKELTFLSQGVRFRGHVGGIGVWSLHHLSYFPQKDAQDSCAREDQPREPLWPGPRGVDSAPHPAARPQGPRLRPRASQPRPRLRAERDFRFQLCRRPAKRILLHVHTDISAGWDGARVGHRRPHGSLRVVSGHRPERGGSGRRAARWRRPSPSEWRLQEGRARAEVHTARLATLKPVPWTAPWRRRCRVRPHAGVSADAITLPKRPRTRLAICQAGERSCAEVDDNQLSRQSGGGKTGNLCVQVGGT